MSRFLPLLAVLFLTNGLLAETPTQSRDTHERMHSVLWVQTSPEFQIACEQVFLAATAQLNEALDDPFWTAATEQTNDYWQLPPAVIFDIDETVLDNSPLQARLVEGRVDYVHDWWLEWEVENKADAIPGAARFVKLLRARGVTPIFASNRGASSKEATLDNLRRELDYPDLSADQVLLKNERPEWSSDKTSRRKLLAEKYRIIFLFGDVYDDFVELGHVSSQERMDRAMDHKRHWGKRWFLLPNPSYGNWERSLYDFQPGPDALERKFDALELKR
jgi:5'-nucleotidase (lipoprotein e(P4) family)